jgi:diaminohydroxyphosphoribosylaminopyrimidine deaminase / 5-amino-6-(5-phosphoribosylamino)uracil reductase
MFDKNYMTIAISLAKRGWGKTSPNPMVGAVIVKNNKIIGKGYHKCAGKAHAEINAISDAGIANCEGSTIYVTLEPCSTTGKTPPCTDAIISAKFAKVVIGCLDANPLHAGNAVDILKKTGIEVVVGIEEDVCKKLNAPFFHWVESGRPYVILKMAMTLDGKIATSAGASKWITGAVARKRVQNLRKWSDAIMVGGETVRNDTPSLNVRSPKDPTCELRNWIQPKIIVASHSLTVKEALRCLPCSKSVKMVSGKSRNDWLKVLKELGNSGITRVLVEGGGELAASLLSAKVINRVEFHIAPKILGGKDSRPVIGGLNPSSISDALELKNVEFKKLGKDFSISGDL